VRLLFRDQVGLLLPTDDGGLDEPGPLHVALREHLAARGASFWPELQRAAAEAGEGSTDEVLLDALWDLVWAGEVTNDSFVPLRARIAGKARRSGGRRSARRPNLHRLSRVGPPAGAGRWSLVAPLREPVPTPTEAAHARALQLLERYGVLTREAALGEGTEGGFAGVYPVLKALEEQGRVRRGYFVAGLGAAQFALPGAIDHLRSARSGAGDAEDEPTGPVVLAATDPAQPYGAAIPWPESAGRPARAAGAHVVLADGHPVAFLERGGRSVVTFPAAADHPDWVDSLVSMVKDGRRRSIEITRADGEPVRDTPVAELLRSAGFVEGYRGLVYRERPSR
jgi:ATP-dependent Lhr-like helicase